MQHRFEFHQTKEDYVAGLGVLMEQLRRTDRQAKRRMWEQILLLLAVLAMVGILFPNSTMGIVVGIFLFSLFEYVLRPRWMRGVTGTSYDPAVADVTVLIDDDGIAENADTRVRRWPWSGVRQVHDNDAGLIFELAGWDMIVLPAHLWADAVERQAFAETLPCTVATPDPNLPNKFGPVFNELLPLAAFAVPLELLWLLLTVLPYDLASYVRPSSPGMFYAGLVATIIVIGAVGYAIFRVVRLGLIRLHNRSPQAASIVIQLIIWTVMITLLAQFLGWI